MEVNGVQAYTNAEIREIWVKGRKVTFQRCDELAKQGYVFVVNNNQNFGYSAKWEPYQPIKVTQSKNNNPNTLWAIKPEPTGDLTYYYNNVAWR